MKKVVVLLASGFEEIEAITIIDVLRRADFRVTTTSIEETLQIKGAHEISIIADKLFTEVDFSKIDMLVLPGGMPGAKNLNEHAGLKKQILDFNKEQKPLGAICAAPQVFGHLNLLVGKKAVCYPGFEQELYDAVISDEPVMVSGNIITARGVGAALNFSLKIVELLDSKEKANKLAKAMLVESF